MTKDRILLSLSYAILFEKSAWFHYDDKGNIRATGSEPLTIGG